MTTNDTSININDIVINLLYGSVPPSPTYGVVGLPQAFSVCKTLDKCFQTDRRALCEAGAL